MSEITVTVERIEAIEPHPNADKLEIAKVAGTQTLIVKGQFRAGDLCVYFPPDILLPGDVSEALGVAKYLKTATWDGLEVSVSRGRLPAAGHAELWLRPTAAGGHGSQRPRLLT